jgi:hypothetical protein
MATSLRTKLAIAMWVGLIGCLCLLSGDTLAQPNPDPRYFPETGHAVDPLFRPFFESHGDLPVFGYPITESHFSAEHGRWLQYFQNARLETEALGEPVVISPLPMNLLVDRRTPPISAQQVGAGGEFFPATGHSVMLAFLDFYLHHGGPEVFGYPIAELDQDGDRLVQYFERAILEWHPELPNGQRVQLAPVGELHCQTDLCPRDQNLARPQIVTAIRVSGAVGSAVMSQRGGDQIIYVRVTDQLGQPVVGARVDVSVSLPRTRLTSPVALTDDHGLAAFQVAIPRLSPGATIPVQIHADYLDHGRNTATGFRIWW